MKVYFEFCNRDIKPFEIEISALPKKGQLIHFNNIYDDYSEPVYCRFKVKKVELHYDLETIKEKIVIPLKAIN